jgi:hypothetical protein
MSKAVLPKGDEPVGTIEWEGLTHADVLAEVCHHQP